MKTRVRRISYYSTALWFAAENGNAGQLRKVWEVNLKENIKEVEHTKVLQPTVFALRFSPDGQNIAVVVEQYVPEGSKDRRSHLLVIPVPPSNASIRQFEISAGVSDLDSLGRWESFEWTAAGDAILADGELVRLRDGSPCSPALGPIENAYAEEGRIARFLLLDRDCRVGADWKFAGDWILNDLSMDRSLL